MTVAELQILLTSQNGILTEQNVLDFRNSYFALEITQAWMSDFIDLDNDVDWVLSHNSVYELTSKIVVDFLLTDNPSEQEQEQIDLGLLVWEYDVVVKQKGNQAERKLQLSALPQDLQNQILLEISFRASSIESTKLQNAINNVP